MAEASEGKVKGRGWIAGDERMESKEKRWEGKIERMEEAEESVKFVVHSKKVLIYRAWMHSVWLIGLLPHSIQDYDFLRHPYSWSNWPFVNADHVIKTCTKLGSSTAYQIADTEQLLRAVPPASIFGGSVPYHAVKHSASRLCRDFHPQTA